MACARGFAPNVARSAGGMSSLRDDTRVVTAFTASHPSAQPRADTAALRATRQKNRRAAMLCGGLTLFRVEPVTTNWWYLRRSMSGGADYWVTEIVLRRGVALLERNSRRFRCIKSPECCASLLVIPAFTAGGSGSLTPGVREREITRGEKKCGQVTHGTCGAWLPLLPSGPGGVHPSGIAWDLTATADRRSHQAAFNPNHLFRRRRGVTQLMSAVGTGVRGCQVWRTSQSSTGRDACRHWAASR